jgi:import inner membrane translocase subunit TIM23
MASSSLKTLVLRWPAAAPVAARPTSFARCCPRSAAAAAAAAPFSSLSKAPSVDRFACLAARASLRQQSAVVSRSFTRGYADLAQSAQKAPNATNNKTATALGSKPQVKPTGSSASVGVDQPTLDWDSFFKLRVRRRYFQLFFSLVGGVGGGAAGAILLAQGYAEPLVQQVPLDPLFTLGLMTFACAGLGWLIGPSIGSEIFYVINRRFKLQMRQKESQFLSRVRKNRADPTNSNAANPVPDFYGEKIQSVKGYRQWLKDQRAFNKKKTQNFI